MHNKSLASFIGCWTVSLSILLFLVLKSVANSGILNNVDSNFLSYSKSPNGFRKVYSNGKRPHWMCSTEINVHRFNISKSCFFFKKRRTFFD